MDFVIFSIDIGKIFIFFSKKFSCKKHSKPYSLQKSSYRFLTSDAPSPQNGHVPPQKWVLAVFSENIAVWEKLV